MANARVYSLQQSSLQHDPIKLYHYRGSFSSQKVLLYLHERQIDFSGFHVDLQRNEHLAPWYLEINPKGEVGKVCKPTHLVAEERVCEGAIQK